MSLSIDAQLSIAKKTHSEPFTLDVSFTVGNGEILGLLGPSGCGKSMTLKCIAGIINPDKGKVQLGGVALFDGEKGISLPTRQRRVGYLFQSYALFPHMTVAANICCGMTRMPRESKEQYSHRCREELHAYLELLHMEQFAQSYPRHLSGGQQQRVALARLLASRPDAILLDEPFSALDDELKDSIDQELKATLLKTQCPVVFVSHNAQEIQRYCSRTLHLVHGHLRQEGKSGCQQR